MATTEVCLGFNQVENLRGWFDDHPMMDGDVIKLGVGPNGLQVQHIMAPDTLETMNGHNNPPELV